MLLDSHPFHWHPQQAKFSIITDNHNLILSYQLFKKSKMRKAKCYAQAIFSYINLQENKFLVTFNITFSFS